jgi:hypothetical protein
MIQNVLSGIDGVGIYGVISICIFVAVFLGVVAWLLGLKKNYLQTMQQLPLEEDDAAKRRVDPNLKPDSSHE